MNIINLERRKGIEASRKLTKAYDKMQALIEALNKKEMPSVEIKSINEQIESINSFQGAEKALTKILKKTYSTILKNIEEKLKLVTKHHYRNLWMVYGMLAATVLSTALTSFKLLSFEISGSVGLSMGMLIGILIGTTLDNQAEKEGRRLEI